MTDYTPPWLVSFPEPHAQDERPLGSTGPRREPLGLCYYCGEDVHDRPFFGDATCGKPKCREKAASR